MPIHAILIDLLALAVALAGFHIAFRQRAVRHWLNAVRTRSGRPPLVAPPAKAEEDPAHYAGMIYGTMGLAFGIVLFGFTTIYALAS
jgi:hypothetical protein